jgi:hypothetical protein
MAQAVVIQMDFTAVFIDKIQNKLDVRQVAGEAVNGFEHDDFNFLLDRVSNHCVKIRANPFAGAFDEGIVPDDLKTVFVGVL